MKIARRVLKERGEEVTPPSTLTKYRVRIQIWGGENPKKHSQLTKSKQFQKNQVFLFFIGRVGRTKTLGSYPSKSLET